MKRYALFVLIALTSSMAAAEICGKEDNRALSIDPKVGRFVREGQTQGCVATLISNSCAITAGECADNHDYVEFNVPTSIEGVPQAAAAEDRYYVNKSQSVAAAKGGIGDRWAVIRLQNNKLTGKAPGETQGYYRVATKKHQDNESIRVVQFSYALNNTDAVLRDGVAPRSDADVRHFAQQVAQGKLVKAGIFLIPSIVEHDADTTTGSSGAPIISNVTNEIVGLNTHGGCRASYYVKAGARYTNSGTSTTGSKAFRKAIAACLAQ